MVLVELMDTMCNNNMNEIKTIVKNKTSTNAPVAYDVPTTSDQSKRQQCKLFICEMANTAQKK